MKPPAVIAGKQLKAGLFQFRIEMESSMSAKSPVTGRVSILVATLLLGVAWTPLITSADDSPSLTVPRERIDFSSHDLRGTPIRLADYEKSRCVVLVFLGTECPLAQLYAGRLQQMSQEYSPEDVQFLGVNSNAQDNITEIEAFVRRHRLTFPMIKDAGNKLADQLGAERTPHAFLLDQERKIRYHGRIDDQYVVGAMRTRPDRDDLKIAINQVLQGQPVTVPATPPQGCLIGRIATPAESSPVTYSNQIARIFQSKCQHCHRKGDIGPFPLITYEDTIGWGPMIAEVVRERRMPPWHADPNVGTFENDHSLSAEEQELIFTWVKNGCPEGNPADLPEPIQYTDGWQLPREPDLVVPMRDRPFDIPAQTGPQGIEYKRFWVPTNFETDRWVDGMEVRPGNRAVVHHIIVYTYPKKGSRQGESFLTAYVPGLRLNPLPPGAAKRIPAGSWMKFEVHYTPNGTPQQDLSELGLNFIDADKVTHEVRTTVVGKQDFVILPEKSDQTFTARSAPSPAAVDLISMSPHMHLRGQAFEYEAEYPDGSRELLLRVPRYDFNWQTRYQLASPKRLPAGTVIHCKATFDNSARNLNNPDPTATVRWGDQSWEEMFLGYMDIMFPRLSQNDEKQLEMLRSFSGRVQVEDVFRQIDKNGDGRISPEEAKVLPILHNHFQYVDKNKDGSVDLKELTTVMPR